LGLEFYYGFSPVKPLTTAIIFFMAYLDSYACLSRSLSEPTIVVTRIKFNDANLPIKDIYSTIYINSKGIAIILDKIGLFGGIGWLSAFLQCLILLASESQLLEQIDSLMDCDEDSSSIII